MKTNENGFLGYNSIDLLTLNLKKKKSKSFNFECFKNLFDGKKWN